MPLLNVFSHSPINPLQEHMEKAQCCVELLLPFFEAVLSEDWQKAKHHQKAIADMEYAADDLKLKMRLSEPQGLLVSLPKTDVLDLLNVQDSVANKAEDIAGLIYGRKMEFPSTMAHTMQRFLQRSIDATTQAKKAINELDALLATGFSGNEVDIVKAMVRQLNTIEDDTDALQVQLRTDLFAIESTLAPINVMFLYRVIEEIGDLADRAQQVGERLLLLLR